MPVIREISHKKGVVLMTTCFYCGEPLGDNVMRYTKRIADEDPFSCKTEDYLFCCSDCAGAYLVENLCESIGNDSEDLT